VLVDIFTAQMLQDAHRTDIGAQRKQLTPTGAADSEIGRNALVMLRVSNQRSAGAYDPNDNAHQGEWERHSGRRLVRAEMHMAQCGAISRAVRIEDAHTPTTNHDRPHEASCHRAQSEADVD
jgi:hypothetical protein